MTAEWGILSAGMPGIVAAAQARAKALTAVEKLPQGTAEKVDAVKTGWAEVGDALKAGNLAEAMSKGKAVQAQLTELVSSLGMKIAGAAK